MEASAPGSAAYPTPTDVELLDCPIETSLRFLGRKWTLPILRDVAFFPKASFGLIRSRNAGLRPRVLSLRLKELAREEMLRRVVPEDDVRHPYYELTPKGREVWPILASLFQFGTKYYADRVFADRGPRSLPELFPRDGRLMLGSLADFGRGVPPAATRADRGRSGAGASGG